MAYTALARKYRSRTFTEVIGQEAIATTLMNAIKADRIHHGYLFTGTRGVGKTSMARILAKALNCQKYDAPTATPCGVCDICRSIAEGQDVDVLEIDAASNTGVDNIRELRSNTAYQPARARFKVYIIDEVHMLSTGAFNALLKTLEEPPPHVKFILATTEIQKVPATIQSRCQRFNFRNIGPDDIARRLGEIVRAEQAEPDPAAIQRVARLANGSMRDALSILDQLLSISPSRLDAKVLDEILPPAADERIFRILASAADGDAAAVLGALDEHLSAGQGLEVFCSDAIEVVRTLMLVRTCGADASLVDLPAGARDEYVRLAQRFELSHYVQMIAMLEELRRNVRYSGVGRALAEAVLVRFAHLSQWSSLEQLLRVTEEGGGSSSEKKKHPLIQTDPQTGIQVTGSAAAAGRDNGARQAFAEQNPVPGSMAVTAPRDLAPPPGTEFDPAARSGDGQSEATSADYHPQEPEAPASVNIGDGERAHRGASATDRALVEQDPVVRQTLRLFDGIVIDVQRRTLAAPGSTE